MKASKKVMESVIVSGLALTLAVTAVTGNGVNIAAKDAADTQFVNNGIAGVASAMNEYELESADYLDRYISVEKTNAALVAATADGTVISGNDTKKEETTEKETVSEEEQEWQNKLMAKVDDFLYVREKADSDSEIVGLGCGTCTFICPTCQCYDIRDFNTGHGVKRFRCWDSCMYSDFTKMSAGQPRLTQLERFRQRFMHKLVYYPTNNEGLFSCVGCGRCMNRCPIQMNIVKVMKKLGGSKQNG